MAIDTRNRRASCVLLGVGFARVWPTPDASLANQADRQHLAYLYAAVQAAVTYFDGLTTSRLLMGVGH